jgi:hypothetical protein
LQSGVRIMRDLRIKSTADEHIITKSLAPAFTRLSIQAILYVDTVKTSARKALAIELMEFSECENSILETFTTLDEVRDSMNQATSGMFRMFYMLDPDQPYSAQSEILPLYDKYSKQLADWSKAFERFMEVGGSKLSCKQLRGAAMLKLQHTTASIMANVCPPCLKDPRPRAQILAEPGIFVPFLRDFEAIIQLSRSLIAVSEEDRRKDKSLNFSVDVGIIGPLYYCGLLCPDDTLRIAAIDLLHQYPRREGMWDSTSLARLVRGYWAVQEKTNAPQNFFINGKGDTASSEGIAELVFEDGMKWEWRWRAMPRAKNLIGTS